MIEHKNIPADLRALNSWLVWQLVPGTPKPRKIPHYPATGRRRAGEQGSPADRAGFSDLDTALLALDLNPAYAGLGFAMLPEHDLVFLDFDHCVTDGVIDERVAQIVAPTYHEISPSGTGVRAVMRGSLVDAKDAHPAGGSFGFEVFHSTGFVTVTGDTRGVPTICGLTPDVLALYEERFGAQAGGAAQVDDFARAMAIKAVGVDVLAELRDALTALKPHRAEDRGDWIKVLHALHSLSEAGYEPEALDMAHEFSKQCPAKYDADDLERTWSGMHPRSITYKTIFEMAQKDGWINPKSAAGSFESNAERLARQERERSKEIGEGALPMPTQRLMTGSEMLDELVFIAEGSRVSYIHTPHRVLPFNEFRNLLAASTVLVKRGGRKVKQHLLATWLAHPERKTVQTQTFAPGRGAVCASPDGETAQNLWIERTRAVPANWRELARAFFEHVAYLVPIEEERERFLDWLAHIEQKPGELPSTHYLMVTEQTGIGRNWMAYALARMLAGYTALGYDLRGTLNSGFNGRLSKKLLAVVDELHEGDATHDTRQQEQRLKSMLTEETRTINPKYGRQHVEFNCCRFLMLSNHDAALPLAENDRRVIVIQNPTERKPAEYYRALYTLLDAPGFGDALAEALRRRDISQFNPGAVAPINDAKRKVIRAGRTELEKAVRDIARQWPSECITSERLTQQLREAVGEGFKSLAAAAKAGIRSLDGVLVRLDDGKRRRVWALRNIDQWEDALPAAVADEVKKGERTADKHTNAHAGAIFEGA